jgi:glutamate 5-kinase
MKIVIKIGTSALTDKDGFLNKKYISEFSNSIADLKAEGFDIVIVSSGAIGAGRRQLNFAQPKTVRQKQALAAIGQPIIMSAYSQEFSKHNINAAQLLLTRDNFDNREKYINIRNTLTELLQNGVIPIINENDTVAVEEINFGDNDTLAALASIAIEADILIMLTDVDGLYDGKPSQAKLISKVEKITPEIESFASGYSSSKKGTGGMRTKVAAAKAAVLSGIDAMVVSFLKHNLLKEIIARKNNGTHFAANKTRINTKKSWIAFSRKTKGYIFVDKKAADILINKGKSLLAAGIIGIEGNFKRGDTVIIADSDKKDFARGLSNYDAADLEKIKGKKTSEIKKILPAAEEEAVHRDNLAIL